MSLKSLFILDESACELIYGSQMIDAIAQRVDLVARTQTSKSISENPQLLKDVEAIFSGWGAPVMDAEFLQLAPKLRVVFYAGGATGGWTTPEFWSRGIALTSSVVANSVPVAEYTLATTLFSLKHGWRLAQQTRETQSFPGRDAAPGCYKSKVGLISLGIIGKLVAKMLQPFDLEVLAYDPFLPKAEADRLGIRLVSLAELFSDCDVVSVHAPELPETENLITGAMLASMKLGATFINTARGSIVAENEMIEVLIRRPDLQAILDVTRPEPPVANSPLYALKNVVLTPHIAGSVGQECRRMGQYMQEELERYLANQPLKWQITPAMAAHSSHRPRGKSKVVPSKVSPIVYAI